MDLAQAFNAVHQCFFSSLLCQKSRNCNLVIYFRCDSSHSFFVRPIRVQIGAERSDLELFHKIDRGVSSKRSLFRCWINSQRSSGISKGECIVILIIKEYVTILIYFLILTLTTASANKHSARWKGPCSRCHGGII